MKSFVTLVAASLVLAACASSATKNNVTAQTAKEAPSTASAQSESTTQGSMQASGIAQADSVYFDFDKSLVKHVYIKDIKDEASYLSAHANAKVTIEGNTDERGSDEYNLALGQRRADAVRKDLEAAGISAKRIATVSYGKEHPRLTCHEEKCWKVDRRADFDNKQS